MADSTTQPCMNVFADSLERVRAVRKANPERQFRYGDSGEDVGLSLACCDF